MITDKFYIIDVMPIHQIQTGIVLIGKLKFVELLTIHRLTERKESLLDPFREEKLTVVKEDEEFQRQLSPNKIAKIVNYLREKGDSRGLFPTSLLVALEYDSDFNKDEPDEDFLSNAYHDKLTSCFINKDKSKLYIPKNPRIALIVDGQHRFYGVKKYFEQIGNVNEKQNIEAFEFVTTFLVGYDIYEVGKIFANVNFTQKPVNRSLYYDIFGAVPDTEKNEIKLAHDLALHLNNNPESPIQDMIKMLGKGYGLFSQAFFVEKMLIHFKSGGVWESIFDDYLANGKEYKKLPVFMKIYLNCIKDAYSQAWPKKIEKEGNFVYSPFSYSFILCKTTGMGAFLRLIRDIYPLVKDDSDEVTRRKITNLLQRIPRSEVATLFSKNGEYGGAGSEGLVIRFYKYLRNRFELF